ncbi:winged helix-turn-helix domain-containing protein [Roseococcus sp. SDR]|uniref:ATP-binding protein n=1 Tax=Roseococcus sp. SDR TaxID=2835532 RepID=UPI001BCDA6C6|nr:winged helix-turn-helix domain-containing protein [Roseococcus sp. SDR]MBS7789495.1 winged helix-turn-helix domain-containing protein [Roseococcus sp. SDR]MBV1844809.1 winged helix-turn-helix domain-containing protein [Roseococcus sp. SDR]
MDSGVTRFGRFQYDPARRLLLKDGEPVRLGGRALALLAALLEQPGELVEKARLMDVVWPGLHVDETNLRSQMAALRRALGDGVDGARLIVNIAGRGYAFVAALSAEAPGTGPPPGPAPRLHPLPVRLTPVLGQDATIAHLVEKLRAQRFVTIFGAGGIGKTTIAVAVAEAMAATFPDPPCFVDFGVVTHPSLAVGHVAAALGAASDFGGDLARLAHHLADRRMLLVLDSCEPIIEATAALAEAVLKAAPGVHVLATSRERLRAEGEWVHRLASMEVPPVHAAMPMEEVLRYPAIQLFLDRARAASDLFRPDAAQIAQVAAICRWLEGIPLAIELAATRVAELGLDVLAERLDARFSLLMKGRRTALPRHQTLRATLDWSYGLLSPRHQQVLARLSVFRGSFARDAAVEIGRLGRDDPAETLEILAELADKSLIAPETGAPMPAYRCLDTTRAYMAEKLAEHGETTEVARLHAAHYLALFERAAEVWQRAGGHAERQALGFHIDNLRAALDWAMGRGGDCVTGVGLILAAQPLWEHFALFDEGRSRIQAALQILAAREQAFPREVMLLSGALAAFGNQIAAPDQQAVWTTTLRLAEQLDDTQHRLRALSGLAVCAMGQDLTLCLELARRYRDLAGSRGRLIEIAKGDRLIGYTQHLLGNQAAARAAFEAIPTEILRRHDRHHLGRLNFDEEVLLLSELALVRWLQGQPQQAEAMAAEAVRQALAMDHGTSLFVAVAFAACPIAILQGGLDHAAEARELLFGQLSVHPHWALWATCFRGLEVALRGDARAGLELLRSGIEAMRPGATSLRNGLFRGGEAACLLALGEPNEALAVLDSLLAEFRQRHDRWYEPEFLRLRALARRALGHPAPEVEAELRGSLALAAEQAALAWELRAATSLAAIMQGEGRACEAAALLRPILARFDRQALGPDIQAARALLDQLPAAAPTPPRRPRTKRAPVVT